MRVVGPMAGALLLAGCGQHQTASANSADSITTSAVATLDAAPKPTPSATGNDAMADDSAPAND